MHATPEYLYLLIWVSSFQSRHPLNNNKQQNKTINKSNNETNKYFRVLPMRKVGEGNLNSLVKGGIPTAMHTPQNGCTSGTADSNTVYSNQY